MADRLNIEINPKLVPILIGLTRGQGRTPDEVVEEALLRYLQWLGLDADLESGIGVELEDIYVDPPEEPGRPREGFLLGLFERIDRGQRERGVESLSEEDAMRLANEELHAMRREGGAGRRERIGR